jgi:hypothetical protein
MVVVGGLRNHAELRKKPRRQFHYDARILIDDKRPPLPCALADISETGARIVLQNECELPERFMLLLTPNGEARRLCRMIWRDGLTLGVDFPNIHP